MYNVFDSYHPVSALVYFCAVIVFPMVFMHPLLLSLSAIAAVAYAIFLCGWRKMWKRLVVGVVFMAFIVFVNVLFNHRGITVLCYLGDNPLTLESSLYGAGSALMICEVMMWFICFNEIIRADKFIYLFGKLSPSVALVISMTLRFVPLLRQRYERLDAAQRGFVTESKGRIGSIKTAAKKLSALIGQSLEGAVVTADSMKARGYGKRRRSCFSIFRFTAGDGVFCALLLLGCAAVAALLFSGGASVTYFPYFRAGMGAESLLVCALYALMGFSPMIIEAVEWLRWSFIQ